MLRLLLFLSVLVLLPHAQLIERVDLTNCPISYYGKSFSEVYLGVNQLDAVICFEGNVTARKECLLLNPLLSNTSTTTLASPAIVVLRASSHRVLPFITTPLLCEVSFELGPAIVTFSSFGNGSQTALSVESNHHPIDVIVYVNGVSTTLLSAEGPTESQIKAHFDISGCRNGSDSYVSPGEDIGAPDLTTCQKTTCSELSVPETTSCRGNQRCQGDGTCDNAIVCTVIGNTIIDFINETFKVPDRCEYTLISSTDVTVMATFRERLITTLSFLDTLEMTENPAALVITFHQDGRVEVDGTAVTLTDTPTTHVGSTGTLSKDGHGIKYTGSDTEIVFDGNSASITYLGAASDRTGAGLTGACTNATALSSFKDSTADPTCTEPQSDPDAVLNCSSSTPPRCDLLHDDPFATCHGVVDPTPYIRACRSTLCYYPERDGFSCQFMKNYARECSNHDVTLQVDWFSLDCAHHKAFCGSETCLDEEYCGMASNGRTGCFCRGDFSKPYRLSGTYGGELTCSADSATLKLYGCFLEENDISPISTHLMDEACKGSYDTATKEVTLMFTSADTCMSTVKYVGHHVIFSNTITAGVDPEDIIRRHGDLIMNFSCSFAQPNTLIASFMIETKCPNHTYTVEMKAYTDADLSQAVTEETAISVDQKIWMTMRADGPDNPLTVAVTDTCWATDQVSPSGGLMYYLIMDGCPVDPSVEISSNMEGISNSFSFSVSQFSNSSGDVYVFCRIRLCDAGSESCGRDCTNSPQRNSSTNVNDISEGLSGLA